MSAELTQHILTQIAFKRLSGKAMTSGKFSLPDETLGSTVQSSATTIFGESVPNNPVSQSARLFEIQSGSDTSPGTVQLVEFDLVRVADTNYANSSGVEVDTGSGNWSGISTLTIAPRQGFGAALGIHSSTNTYHAYTIKLPSNYESGSTAAGFATNASTAKILGTDAPFENGFMSTASVQMQVVPEYLSTITGTTNAYIPRVINTNGNVLSTTDAIDYYFDGMAGVLFVQDPSVANNANPESQPSDDAQPGKVRAFLYVGKYQSEVGGDSVDLHFSASEGTGFSFGNTATASFTSGSGEGLTVTAGSTNNIEFALVNVVSSSDGTLFNVSASTATANFNVTQGATASFIDGGAGLTVETIATNKVQIGKTTDNFHVNNITGSNLMIEGTASISYFETLYETSSIIYTSGSTKFGDTMDDQHDFTGSVFFSSSEFGWDTPSGSLLQVPLVYDPVTQLIHTGSAYALDADGMSQFQVSGSLNGFDVTNNDTITFTTSSGTGLTITADVVSGSDTLTFGLVNVVSSSDQIADEISGSMQWHFRGVNSGGATINAGAIGSLQTASLTSGVGIDITGPSPRTLKVSLNPTTAPGIALSSSGTDINGGVTSIGLTETASFVGGTGITITNASGTLTIDSDTGELSSPLYIRTGSATTGSSIDYGGTASFAVSGEGLAVDESLSTITYTITPDDVLDGATDTATFNFTSSVAVVAISSSYAISASYAVSASYISGAIDGGASTVQITEENNDTTRLGVVFSNLAAADLDTNGEINEDVILKGDHGVAFSPGRNTFFVGDASTTGYLAENPTGIGVGANDTFNFLTDGVTMFADSTTVAPLEINVGGVAGTVVFKGSASIDGDLIVKGSTTSINTTNLNVEDQFILLASRSAAANLDGGIIVQTGEDGDSTAIGTALFYDDSESRWGLTKADDTAFDATDATPRQYVVSVSSSAGTPPSTPSDFGGSAASRYGMMYVDTSDSAGDGNTIWIYGE